MRTLVKLSFVGLSLALVMGDIEIGGQPVVPGFIDFVEDAEARVGRPLTPASYAGVARRTTRRTVRRTAITVAALPGGCVYGPYYGVYAYACGGVYYQKSGNVYVQITFD